MVNEKMLKLLIFTFICPEVMGRMVFSWLNCTLIDPKFANFDLCQLKQQQGGVKAISIYIRILELPVTNHATHVEIYNQIFGRQIVLVNSTWDSCEFMKQRKRFRAFNRLYNVIGPYTNLNHSCPYDHDIIISNLTLDVSKVPFPLPKGEYLVKTSHLVNDEKKFSIYFSGKII